MNKYQRFARGQTVTKTLFILYGLANFQCHLQSYCESVRLFLLCLYFFALFCFPLIQPLALPET